MDVTLPYYERNKSNFNVPEREYRLAQIEVTPEYDPKVRNLRNDDAKDMAEAERKVLGRVPAGSTADGRIVAVRQGNLLATAFHPELAGDLRVHRLFVELVREAQTQ